MTEADPCWASLPAACLCEVMISLGSIDLARCCLVCSTWRAAIHDDAREAWIAALQREHGYVPQTAAEQREARQRLIAAHTSRVYLAGQAPAGLGCAAPGARFTSPERLLLATGCGQDNSQEGSEGDGSVSFSTAAAAPRRGLGSSISVRAVAAGGDFAVLLTWDGAVLDTRCFAAAGGSSPRRQQRELDWHGLWRPPCCRAVSIAAGGCWQGSGPLGGHVAVVTDQNTVWAWGCNAAGQLGQGCKGSSSDAPLAAAGPATGNGAGNGSSSASWVPAPLEVIDSAAAADLGYPVAAAAGDEHSALLTRSGQVYAAGSNAYGACGQPLVQLRAAAFSPVLPEGETAAALSCGGRNMAAVTRSGRLLACGANEHGQVAVGRQGGCCFLLADVGPSAAWHGMLRANQQPAGGGGDAAARVVGVACGSGSLYAWTDVGEAFSWGQGSQGELGLGGSSKNVCTPSRMPWARDAAWLAAACGGRFAALLDSHNRLFTWGAGKSGALGHGDTAKRTVGRPVKALAGLTVHGAACGSDWMLVVAGWRPPAGKGGRCGGSGDHGKPAVPAAAYAPPPAGEDGGTLGGRFKYAEVEPPPSPRSPHQQRHNSQREAAAGVLSPGSTPSTPMAAHCHSGGGPDAAFAGSSGSGRLRGRSGREQRREERLEERQLGCSARRRSAALELPDDAPEAVASRRQRWMAEPPLAPSAFTPPDSECSSGDEGLPQEDRQMAYLLRRQIKAFSTDPCQRHLVLPRSLSARDRWKAHVLAEGWGLLHESKGEGARRKLVVWKPSRSQRSLKPSMLEGCSSDSGDGDGGVGDGGGGICVSKGVPAGGMEGGSSQGDMAEGG